MATETPHADSRPARSAQRVYRNREEGETGTRRSARRTNHESIQRSTRSETDEQTGTSGPGQVSYDPGPDAARLAATYGIEVRERGEATTLHRLESNFGPERVNQWVEEGMPVEAMGKPRDMRAFRDRAANREPADVNEARSPHDDGGGSPADAVQQVIDSPGTPLHGTIQREMESTMGGDFSDVKLHTGPAAATAATAIDARAFTVGNQIAFNRGEYRPETETGKRILAHELTHVRQQTGGQLSLLPKTGAVHPPADLDAGPDAYVQPDLDVSSPTDPAEREAEAVADVVIEKVNEPTAEPPNGAQGLKSVDAEASASVYRSPDGDAAVAQPREGGGGGGETDAFSIEGERDVLAHIAQQREAMDVPYYDLHETYSGFESPTSDLFAAFGKEYTEWLGRAQPFIDAGLRFDATFQFAPDELERVFTEAGSSPHFNTEHDARNMADNGEMESALTGIREAINNYDTTLDEMELARDILDTNIKEYRDVRRAKDHVASLQAIHDDITEAFDLGTELVTGFYSGGPQAIAKGTGLQKALDEIKNTVADEAVGSQLADAEQNLEELEQAVADENIGNAKRQVAITNQKYVNDITALFNSAKDFQRASRSWHREWRATALDWEDQTGVEGLANAIAQVGAVIELAELWQFQYEEHAQQKLVPQLETIRSLLERGEIHTLDEATYNKLAQESFEGSATADIQLERLAPWDYCPDVLQTADFAWSFTVEAKPMMEQIQLLAEQGKEFLHQGFGEFYDSLPSWDDSPNSFQF